MKRLGLVLFVVLAFLAQTPARRYTRVDLTAGETGRKLFSAVCADGEQAVLSWKNSLYGLAVTEVFETRQGALILDQIIFADPRGGAPPEVAPSEVDDLYQTGEPFTARGCGRSFSRVAYRVAEIGNPKMKIRDRELAFKQEVGFGGVVMLTAAPVTWLELFRP